MCTGFLSAGKRLELGADGPHPSGAGFKWVGAIRLPPLCAYVCISWGDLYLYFDE